MFAGKAKFWASPCRQNSPSQLAPMCCAMQHWHFKNHISVASSFFHITLELWHFLWKLYHYLFQQVAKLPLTIGNDISPKDLPGMSDILILDAMLAKCQVSLDNTYTKAMVRKTIQTSKPAKKTHPNTNISAIWIKEKKMSLVNFLWHSASVSFCS